MVNSSKGKGGNAISRRHISIVFFLIIYVFTVLWVTVFNRSIRFQSPRFDLFWSYREWLSGNEYLGKEILANIVMFIPFGFLTASLFKGSSSVRWLPVVAILAAVFLSLTIETLQLTMFRGLFEWDDVVSNATGALIGMLMFLVFEKAFGNHFRILEIIAGSLTVILCLLVAVSEQGGKDAQADDSLRAYCFQVDGVSVENGVINLEGFAFMNDRSASEFGLILRAEDRDVNLEIKRCDRPDVNRYFSCEYDYTSSGFIATGKVEEDKEYEIVVKWPWFCALPTGVFISGSEVRYVREKEAIPLGLDADFVNDGVLLVSRPDFHCWVYQYEGALFWVADPDFNFEEDGSTYIQYQLWTTQKDRLPEKRLENGYLWDNIGGYFEKYEIKGNFGQYRVMKRDLPTAYAITAIVTGYYKDGAWIWKEYFRPRYEL